MRDAWLSPADAIGLLLRGDFFASVCNKKLKIIKNVIVYKDAY